MRVLAIDPGERVGWAHGKVVGDDRLEITGHGISHLKDFALKLHEVTPEYDVIVFETFRLRATAAKKLIGNDFQTSQLIGAIRLCAWLHPQVKLVGQGPNVKATALKTCNAEIRDVLDGLPQAHDDAHDGDALLHLWHFYWERFV